MSEYKTHPHYHLLTAMYNWIVENGGVPHVVVPLAEVPASVHALGDAKSGTIVLNIAPHATGMFDLGVDRLVFRARFRGVDTQLDIPTDRILAIFDRNTPDVVMHMPLVESVAEASETPKRPTLSVVK